MSIYVTAASPPGFLALTTVHKRTYIQAWTTSGIRRRWTANLQKHGVDFADAVGVLFDDFAITIMDESSIEERFITIGVDPLNRILVVVYTWRGDVFG